MNDVIVNQFYLYFGILGSTALRDILARSDPALYPPIPPQSLVQLPANVDQFQQCHLQSAGLINDGNTCCLLSFMLCCHRIILKVHVNAPPADVRSLMFLKVLEALPCPRSFSLQLFMRVWNTVRYGASLGQNQPPLIEISDQEQPQIHTHTITYDIG